MRFHWEMNKKNFFLDPTNMIAPKQFMNAYWMFTITVHEYLLDVHHVFFMLIRNPRWQSE